MPEATRQAYDNLAKTLEANGLTFADVVKETVYTTDVEEFKKTGGIRKSYYRDRLPAATWVEVRRLYDPKFVVEIEVTAEYR
jgi:enamine deaminase RidA (YjgF/YER057c/UK114 family)